MRIQLQGPAVNNRHQDGDDVIYSDPDDDYNYIPTYQIPSAPCNINNEPQFQNELRPVEARKPLAKKRKPHRKLVSSAVIAARDASQQTEQDEDVLGSTLPSTAAGVSLTAQPLSTWNPSNRPAYRPALAKPSFVGKTVIPSSRPAVDNNDTVEEEAGDDTDDHQQQQQIDRQQPDANRTEPAMYTAPVQCNPVARPNPTSAMTKNADGLNVVVMQRKMSAAEGTETRKSVNIGWGSNFVRMDMKKGKGSTKFRNGKTNFKRRGGRGGRGRWQVAKLRQGGDGAEFLDGWGESRLKCFRCGGSGHWAKDCHRPAVHDENVDDGSSDDEGPRQQQHQQQQNIPAAVVKPVPANVPEAYAAVAANPTEEGIHSVLKEAFGFDSLRGLQYESIKRVLEGKSCLTIMPTGMGKSLCYQLPALLLGGLTLVISPLVALMKDQVASMPPCLSAAMLWSEQTQEEAKQVLADVRDGVIRVLFVSPERVTNAHLLAALQPRMPLPLVVVDEAHCVAEWGHSFRPAYYRLGGALQREVACRSILALTATATKDTEASVSGLLNIAPENVLRDSSIMPNLRLNVTRHLLVEGRRNWNHIVQLIKTGDLADTKSIIVYCAWKMDADTIAKQLAAGGVVAKAYHAGRTYKERAAIEQAFAAGRIRVVVATVAFGMGINLHCVKGIVHSTLPRSLEEYVQQVGRAGRDGNGGKCYAFLDSNDFVSLRSLAYSGTAVSASISSLLSSVFIDRQAEQASKPTKSRKRTLGADQPDILTVDGEEPARQFGMLQPKKLCSELDMQEETMESILSFLEAQNPAYVRFLPKTAVQAKVSFYGATPEELVETHPIVRAVLSVSNNPRNGVYSAPTADLATALQKIPGACLQDLQELASKKIIGFQLSSDKGLAYEILHRPEDVSALAEQIHERLSKMLQCQIFRLDKAYRAFSAAAAVSQPEEQEALLRKSVADYFGESIGAATDKALPTEDLPLNRSTEAVLNAAKAVLRKNKEQAGPALANNPCAVARILHGTGSAGFSRDEWSKRMGSFWGSHKTTDFQAVVAAATIACRDFTE